MADKGNMLNEIVQDSKELENRMRSIDSLTASFTKQMKQAAETFDKLISVSSFITFAADKSMEAVNTLKEINTLQTEISKANSRLSKSDLARISNQAFDTASKYGKSVTDYLSSVKEISRAGYENAEGIAKLAVAAASAGDMTTALSTRMILAADRAYKLGGSVDALQEILDGINQITNHNTVNMEEFSEALSIAGSTAASFGVEADELITALGTMSAVTGQSISEAAKAFKAVLFSIRQVADEEEGIDAEDLAKYETACRALGVSLKEVRNGILELRDPMEVLKELSIAYSQLGETDIRKTNLLDAVGSDSHSTQLDALLRQWPVYEEMLKQYENGAGSLAAEAEKSVQSWEGALNRLSNTWTDTVGNIAESDAVVGAVNSLNDVLSVVNDITGALGSMGTIGLGTGIIAFVKSFA